MSVCASALAAVTPERYRLLSPRQGATSCRSRDVRGGRFRLDVRMLLIRRFASV